MRDDATLGAILAGGLARRLGGGDKGFREVGGRAILHRVVERLKPQVRRLVLNANGDSRRFAGFGLPVVPDSLPGELGPLAGLLAVLDWAALAAPECQFVATMPGDAPFIPHDLVSRLHESRRAAGAVLAYAASGGRTHPVVALWPVSLRAALREAIEGEGLRKVGAFVARFPGAVAAWPADPVDPFFNINTPEDLTEAERLAAAHPRA